MLVGRDAEQSAIDRLVAGARLGAGGSVVVTGDAGVGKTALLGHAVDVASDMRVLRAAGSVQEQDVAFAGLWQLIRPTIGLLDRIPEPQQAVLGGALALRAGVGGDRFAIGAATLSLLTRAAEDRPLLLVLDDVHEMDRPSVEAVLFVARRVGSDPIGVVAAARSDPGSGPLMALPQLELGGLDEAAAERLAGTVATGAISPELARRLHRATSGNPLAVLELARDLPHLDRLPPEVPLPVPDVLASAFGRRIASLDAAAREALLVAAVADGDLAVTVRAGADLGVDPTALERAEGTGLLRLIAGRAEFAHPLVRSAVYTAASATARRAAHRAVAEALPASDLERRTWHRGEATVGVDDDLADDLDRVGARARDRSAYAVAATAQERAAGFSGDPGRRAARLVAAGESAWLGGQVDRARALLDQATGQASGAAELAAVDGLRGSIEVATGSLSTGRDLLDRAARQLCDADPDTAVHRLADSVMASFWMGDVAAVTTSVELFDRLADRATDPQTRGIARLGAGAALVLAGADGIERLRRGLDELAAAEVVADPGRPVWPVVGVLFVRESETGRALLRRAVEDVRSRAGIAALPHLLFLVARDEATTDRWRSAASHYAEAIALAGESGQRTLLAMCLAGQSWLHARMGEEQACRAGAAEARDLAERHEVHMARIWATYALGDLELGLGRPDAAIAHYEDLESLLDERSVYDVDLWPGPDLAEALARANRDEEAAEVGRRYLDNARAKGQPWALARAERAVASTATDEGTEERFATALDLHRQTPDRYEEARTRLVQGALLRRRRLRVRARPLLRAALETFETLGAVPWAETAARELAATGETVARRGADPQALLTPQELQIARMLVAGRTTRETAAALFLSPKTVEYHLRKVYTKLDVHSRADLARTLAEDVHEG